MSEIEEITRALISFRDERNWEQFHKSRDLALAISIEAAELNELFLWKKDDEEADPGKVREELADILAYSFLLAARHGFDVKKMVLDKIRANAVKYPVDKARDSAKKYDQL